MTLGPGGAAARCELHGLGAAATLAVVTAIVDQLCAAADVDAGLLAAIDLPVGEAVAAALATGAAITSVRATDEHDGRLQVDLDLDRDLPTPTPSGLSDELLAAFSEVAVERRRIHLSLDLR